MSGNGDNIPERLLRLEGQMFAVSFLVRGQLALLGSLLESLENDVSEKDRRKLRDEVLMRIDQLWDLADRTWPDDGKKDHPLGPSPSG